MLHIWIKKDIFSTIYSLITFHQLFAVHQNNNINNIEQ